jgi:rhodanese-related sulfurtransferase
MFRSELSALLAMLLLFTASATMAAHGEGGKESPYTVVTAEEVKASLTGKNKVYIIDVRSLAEYKYSHIPGAVNVPSPAVKMLSNRLPKDKSAQIIVYERGDSILSTERAVKSLDKMGYKNIKHYSGGILQWLNMKYPLNKGDRP